MKTLARNSISTTITGIIGIWIAAPFLLGQDASKPSFAVASIKPSDNRGFTGVDVYPGGRLTANAPLIVLMENAFNLKRAQIQGGPDWVNSDIYHIEAKSETNLTAAQMRVALQSLLEQRFKLVVRKEIKPLKVYELTQSKQGIKFVKLPGGNCAPSTGGPAGPPQPGVTPCGSIHFMVSPAGIRVEGRRASMAELATRLSYLLDRPVVDKTGYTGPLDVQLQFVRDQAILGLPGRPTLPGGSNAMAESSGPSVFTALQEQLGLKLASSKDKAETIVIQSVQRPTAN